MQNSEYWQIRFGQLEEAQNAQGKATLLEIERQYKQAQKQLEGQIARWYQRFADNNGISLAEARQYLKGADLQEFKWDVQDYIKYGQDNALMGGWVKELENASAKYHISKLEALKIHTQQSLEVMFSKQLGTVAGAMGDVFESGYYHTAYELQKGFGIGWDIAGLDQSHIEKVLAKPWAVDGYNFSERIWKNKSKLISEVHGELTQNIMLGADPQKAIDSLAKKMNTSKYNAGRLVMTEEAYFSSIAQRDCFKDLDVEQYEIVAALDSHTSDICRSLDGKHFPMKDYQPGVTAPPFHVYCRSTTVPYFDENFGDIGERAARDENTGKTYYIPDDMNYQEWEDTFVKGGDKSGFDVFDDGSTLHYTHQKPPEPAAPPKKEYLTKKKLQAKIAEADVQIEDLQQKIADAFEYPSYEEIIKDFGSVEDAGSGIEEAHTIVQGKKEMDAIEKKYGGYSELFDKGTETDKHAYGEWDQKVFDAADKLSQSGQTLDSWGSEQEIEQLYSEFQEAKGYNSQLKTIEAQKAEWQEKLNEKLKAEQKKTLLKQQVDLEAQKATVQQQLDNLEVKTYSGIWKEDKTTADWGSLNIEGKKSYYEGKFISESDPDKLKKYQDLYKQLEELDLEGSKYNDVQQQLKKIEAEISKVQSDLKNLEKGDIIDLTDDTFSPERKQAALWAKTVKQADNSLRAKSGEVWKAAPKSEKDAIYGYTSSYSKFNEPLRGIEYGTNAFKGVGNIDFDKIGTNYGGYSPGEVRKQINAMTDIISKSTYDFDIWLQRGCDYGGMDHFFEISMSELQSATQAELEKLLLGKTVTDYGFFSCGVSKGKGFSHKPIIMNVYAPKGTQMMYAEPFSAFGNGSGRSWDGVSGQSSFGSEAEIILQQGTSFRVTKVERSNGKLYVDIEVVMQNNPQR
jgi:SPP1 gp7 family putative phage head morphogenesis protein